MIVVLMQSIAQYYYIHISSEYNRTNKLGNWCRNPNWPPLASDTVESGKVVIKIILHSLNADPPPPQVQFNFGYIQFDGVCHELFMSTYNNWVIS